MNRRHNDGNKLAWISGTVLVTLGIVSFLFRYQLLVIVIVACVSYVTGKWSERRKETQRRIVVTKRLRTNAAYGHAHTSYAWGPAGMDVRGPVVEMDAVSPYPPSMTTLPAETAGTDDRKAARIRMLRDKLSGAHKLFGDDDDE